MHSQFSPTFSCCVSISFILNFVSYLIVTSVFRSFSVFSRIWLLRLFRAQCQFSPVFDWYVNLISHAFSAFSCIGLLCWYLTHSQFSTSFDYNIPHIARSPFSLVFNFFFSISRIPSRIRLFSSAFNFYVSISCILSFLLYSILTLVSCEKKIEFMFASIENFKICLG